MKSIILFFIIFFAPVLMFCQNVGIGIDTPAEKLDVLGNINVSGELKVNGNGGKAGEVLTSTGTGLSWGSTMGFKKFTQYKSAGNFIFTVPADVTEVMVELWGAGSGGTIQTGGTGGGYARTIQTVWPGYEISLTVGEGSGYGPGTTANGGPSLVTFPLGYIEAYGGTGVDDVGYATYPRNGTAAITLPNTFFMYGNTGSTTQSYYSQKNATTFVEKIIYGAGGAAVGLMNTSRAEGDIRVSENGFTMTNYSKNGQHAKVNSTGGGAGSVGGGWDGAPGMVIIWYN